LPEGDTLFQAAHRLGRALTGQTLTAVSGASPRIRSAAGRLQGATVEQVRSHGKHLVIDTSAGLSVRTHLGMTGGWAVYLAGSRRRFGGSVRIVLQTERATAVCTAAPDIDVDSTSMIDLALADLGPDLTGDTFDTGDARRRMAERRQRTVAELITDQTVMAGAGNVYKSEVLFLVGIHPETDPAHLTDDDRGRLIDRSRALLLLNRDRPRRSTTGNHGRGRELWVYGRVGKPCRRCRHAIESAWLGDVERITYWCPDCQPRAT